MLRNQLKEASSHVERYTSVKHSVSDVSVGWHLWHLAKVINQTVFALKQSNSEEYKYRFNLLKTVLLALNWFPLGKGRAPKVVRPKEEITADLIQHELELAFVSLNELDQLPANSFFKHPYFNQLNSKETRKFLQIHTEHHLKIIREVLAG